MLRTTSGMLALTIGALGAALFTPVPAAHAQHITFAPDTPDDYREQMEMAFAPGRGGEARFDEGTRWDGPPLGEPIRLRWSLYREGAPVDGHPAFPGISGNNVLFETLDAQFAAAGVMDPRDAWITAIEQAFALFARTDAITAQGGINLGVQRGTGFQFPRISTNTQGEDAIDLGASDDGMDWTSASNGSGNRGEIRIAMATIDGPGNILAISAGPEFGEIILDAGETEEGETWAQEFGEGPVRFGKLVNVLMRHIGFAVGLNRACPDNDINSSQKKLMAQPLMTSFIGLQPDDLRAVHRLYGDQAFIESVTAGGLVSNDSLANAFPITQDGQLIPPIPFDRVFSLDAADDQDWFRFSVAENSVIQITVGANPVGGSYTEAPLGGGGDCPAPGGETTTLAEQLQQLRLTILDSNSIPLPPTPVTASALGNGVAVDRLEISAEGTYFLRVDSSGAMDMDAPQLYRMTVVIQGGGSPEAQTVPIRQVYNEIDRITDTPAAPTRFEFRNDLPGSKKGESASVVLIDGGMPLSTHVAFGGRPIIPIIWDGPRPVIGALEGEIPLITGHATAALGVAAGTELVDDSGEGRFRGMAPEAQLISVPVAFNILSDFPRSILMPNFQPSTGAIFNGLFTTTDPKGHKKLGLDRPADVILSAIGTLADLEGEEVLALGHDAAAFRNNAFIVVPTGDSGRIDNSQECDGTGDEEDPGGVFVGSKTVTSPATAFNVLSVGASCTLYTQTGGGGTGIESTEFFDAERITPFTGRGPINSFNHDFDSLETETDTRAGVHIVAPGTGRINATPSDLLEVCPFIGDYLDDQRLDVPFLNPDDPFQDDFFAAGLPETDAIDEDDPPGDSGTSYAAAVVAGAAALLFDTARAISEGPEPEEFPSLEGFPKEIPKRHLVMKSVLMTGARKTPGWSNNGLPSDVQLRRDGRTINADNLLGQLIARDNTDQPLDVMQGAGVLDLARTAEVLFGRPGAPSLTDSEVTDPDRPLVRFIETDLPPNPFPDTASVPQEEWDPFESDWHGLPDETPTPIQLAQGSRAARPLTGDIGLWRSMADITLGTVDDPVLMPRDLPVGEPGTTTVEAFVNPVLTGRFISAIDLETINDFDTGERARVIDGPVFGGRFGWDVGNVGLSSVPGPEPEGGLRGHIDYLIGPIGRNDLGQQEAIIATLVWDREVIYKSKDLKFAKNAKSKGFRVPELNGLELENLDLEVYRSSFLGEEGQLVFTSESEFNNVEHVFFPVNFGDQDNFYILRVVYREDEYDFFRNRPRASVPFALSWRIERFEPNVPDQSLVGRLLSGLMTECGEDIPGDCHQLRNIPDPDMGGGGAVLEAMDSGPSLGETLDANGDGEIDPEDLSSIIMAFGSCEMNPGCPEDINDDNFVDTLDVMDWVDGYQTISYTPLKEANKARKKAEKFSKKAEKKLQKIEKFEEKIDELEAQLPDATGKQRDKIERKIEKFEQKIEKQEAKIEKFSNKAEEKVEKKM